MPLSESFKRTAGKAMGRIPSGVFVITAGRGEQATALLASWVQQASFDPPMMSIAIARDRPILELIRSTRKLAISIIADADRSPVKRFARAAHLGASVFDGIETDITPDGPPILRHALAWCECELKRECDFDADHVLLLAQVTAGDILQPGRAFTHQRGSGMHY